MKKIMALVMAGVISFSTPIIAGAATNIVSPDASTIYKEGYDSGFSAGEYKGKADALQEENAYYKQQISQMQGEITNLRTQLITELAAVRKDIIELAKNQGKTYKITIKANDGKSKTVTLKASRGHSDASPQYYHTISSAPGLDGVLAVGQAGKIVINGAKTRATFVMRETTSDKVASAKVLAAQIGGTVKNVVETYAPGVRFSTAKVNFNVYGAQDGEWYRVYQMGANGTWQEVQVDEVRKDHVVVTVNKPGTFAFIKVA